MGEHDRCDILGLYHLAGIDGSGFHHGSVDIARANRDRT